MQRRILVTGAVRSGKSTWAQARAEQAGPERIFVATARAEDDEMAARIARHQAERGPGWRTVEEPLAIAPLLAAGPVVLVDCLTLWLSNLLLGEDQPLEPYFEELALAFRAAPGTVVLVTNEVGWGIVPVHPLARRFRDASGHLSQRLAREADEVVLCVAGLPMWVKGQGSGGSFGPR